MKRCIGIALALTLTLAMVGCVAEPAVPETEGIATTVTASQTVSTTVQSTTVTTHFVETEVTSTTTTEPSTSAVSSTTAALQTSVVLATTEKTTTQKTTADWVKNYTVKQILRDPTFQNGFDVTGQEEKTTIGTWYNTDSNEDTVWSIGQWGTYKSYTDRSGYLCMLRDRLDTPRHILSNGMNTLTYNDERKSLTFTMNTYEFYGGQGHVNNETWPHLLIGQEIIDWKTYFNLDDEEMLHYSPAADKVIVSLDVRLTSFSHEPKEGINACQIPSFFAIKSLRDSGFLWFGVPIFDDRGYDAENMQMTYIMSENICGIPSAYVHNSTSKDGRRDFFSDASRSQVAPGEEWMRIEVDVKPFLDIVAEKVLKGSQYNVFKQTKDIRDLYFSAMNIGYEIHGTYDVSFEIMNYAITTYVKKT